MTYSQHHPRLKELSFQQLLSQRICDLDLRPSGLLRDCLITLRRELKQKNISFYPNFYFGEEPWGTIDRTGSIEIPFYLANRTLQKIAKRYYMSYTKEELMIILRHETGHATNYAYKLYQRPDWKRLFGNFRKKYRNFYNYDSYSKDFVRYLHYIGNPHYAQKHPDEDFAETFAVWLDPQSKWKWNYRNWDGALEKLRYVDRLFRKEKVALHRPVNVRYDNSDNYKNITCTVAEYFEIEKKVDPRVQEYIQDLKEIFTPTTVRSRHLLRADLFIQNYAEYLEEELSSWIAKADKREIRKYVREIQTICSLNNLRLHPDQATEKLIELVIVSTYHVLNRLRRIRRT
jgi:hypothetical protein